MVLPALVTFAIALWKINGPSYWRDESVSVVLGHGSFAQLRDFLRDADAVHGLYYLFLHAVTVFGTGETVARLPSAAGAALAAGGIAALGRRWHSRTAGLYGGFVYALLPIVSRYAQEARQYTLVSAGTVLATYLLVRAYEQPRLRWYGWYGTLVALLGWLHLYSLFLLSAHAVTVLLMTLASRRSASGDLPSPPPTSPPDTSPPSLPAASLPVASPPVSVPPTTVEGAASLGVAGRDLAPLLRWATAVLGAVVAVAPLILVAKSQEAQVSWLTRPGPSAVLDFGMLVTGDGAALIVVTGLAVVGALALIRTGRSGASVAVPWLVVPVAAALLVSRVHPVYHQRYVLYCVCAFALLAGTGLAALAGALPDRLSRTRPVAGLVVLAVLAVLVAPVQSEIRRPAARPDDLRSFAGVLREQGRPGDGVLYVPVYRQAFVTVYADAFRHLDDQAFQRHGADLSPERFRAALTTHRRIWVIEIPPPHGTYRTPVPLANLAVLRADRRFGDTGRWTFGSIRLTLLTQRP